MKILIFFHFGVAIATAAPCSMESFPGKFAEKDYHRGELTSSPDLQTCLEKKCPSCEVGCAVSYKSEGSECRKLIFDSQIVEWIRKDSRFVTANEHWDTAYIPHEKMLPRPPVLHMYSVTWRGVNFGYERGALDASENYLNYNMRFVKSGRKRKMPKNVRFSSIRDSEYVSLLHSGEHRLKFSPSFTLATFMSIQGSPRRYIIWKGFPQGFVTYVTQSKQRRRRYAFKLTLKMARDHFYESNSITKRGRKSKKKYYHFAIVYHAIKHVEFYFDGAPLNVSYQITENPNVVQADYVTTFSEELVDSLATMRRKENPRSGFACVAYYERPLTQQEVIDISNRCP